MSESARGNVYVATLSAIAVSAVQDLISIVAPAGYRVTIRELKVGQYSDFGDASAELLSIKAVRGATTAGSGGAALTPVNLASGGRPSIAVVRGNDTTQATAGAPATLLADSLNVMAGYWYRPPEDERIILQPGERLVFALTAPVDALTVNATLVWEEYGPLAT